MNGLNLNNLLVIIVLYKEKLTESETYRSLNSASLLHKIKLNLFVYDNSPKPYCKSLNNNLISLEYKHDKLNSGVSKAYNLGAKFANDNGKKFILLLDQDSYLQSDFLIKIDNIISKDKDCKIFAPYVYEKKTDILISPSKFRCFIGSLLKLDFGRENLKLHNRSVINSGLLIDVDFFKLIGGFDERIYLDFSDHEFIYRVSKKVDEIGLIPSRIYHSLSAFEKVEVSNRLFRFETYFVGGFIFSCKIKKKFLFLCISFVRSLILFFRFKNFQFVKIFFKNIKL